MKVPSYLSYTASGYQAVNPALSLYELLIDPWADLIVRGLFDGTHTNAEVGYAVSASTIPASMLDAVTAPGLLAPGGSVNEMLAANNAWRGWASLVKPVFVHCPIDDVVPIENAAVAAAALGMIPSDPAVIHLVPRIPLAAQVMGSIHVGAFPTAMLGAFKIIRE